MQNLAQNVRLSIARRIRSLTASSCRRAYVKPSRFLSVSEEVREAVETNKPVVALETTIYTHGFPYPENIKLSEHLESLVRKNGAIPATIGVLNGVAKVGMSSQEIIELLDKASQGWQTVKLSRRDIGWICGSGIMGKNVNGGTTIAGTMILSHLAGIRVFATGGLGGVHKGGESSLDISADLTELGRTPVALVTSGCKSFLDIPRTLEYLETQGVGVGTFADGRDGSVNFPAFWTRDSGVPSPRAILDEKEAAAIIHAQFNLPLSSGLLFANPIAEEYSLSKEYMDQVMDQAVQDAIEAGAHGHQNTPFVLNRIRDITKGSTITANRELVSTNVVRGARVASELAKLDSKSAIAPYRSSVKANARQTDVRASTGTIDVLVAGSIALDLSGDYTGNRAKLTPHTSNPGRLTESVGGVGRNIALAVSLAGASIKFCSVVGDDSAGLYLYKALEQYGFDIETVFTLRGQSSGRYVALNDGKKDLFVSMADMSIIESTEAQFDQLWKPVIDSSKPKWLALDANWDGRTIRKWIDAARDNGAKVAFEPVSEEKASRLFESVVEGSRETQSSHLVDLATPNVQELKAMSNTLTLLAGIETNQTDHSTKADIAKELGISERNIGSSSIVDVIADAFHVTEWIETLLVTLGKGGVLLIQAVGESTEHNNSTHGIEESTKEKLVNGFVLESGSKRLYVRRYPVPSTIHESQIVSVNGVGDTFFGVLLAGLASGCQLDGDLIQIAQRAAGMTLRSAQSVSPEVASLAVRL